ncbi:hypothetical protein E2C01_005501 [Portunus trituberculatus]|uniref:Uncharacterized protein n=1 Tax=Portunus trituberculatus TaxID=210409 RepID=A0A5B7CVP6_PORTR|nr:hypothetical protein [Portunus trituberculatus]
MPLNVTFKHFQLNVYQLQFICTSSDCTKAPTNSATVSQHLCATTPSQQNLCATTLSHQHLCATTPSQQHLCATTPSQQYLSATTPSQQHLSAATFLPSAS